MTSSSEDTSMVTHYSIIYIFQQWSKTSKMHASATILTSLKYNTIIRICLPDFCYLLYFPHYWIIHKTELIFNIEMWTRCKYLCQLRLTHIFICDFHDTNQSWWNIYHWCILIFINLYVVGQWSDCQVRFESAM